MTRTRRATSPSGMPRAAVLLLGLASLAACGEPEQITRTIGLTRDPPDEFAVTTRAPLSMPPNFALRPPVPGLSRPQELPLSAQAEETLVPAAALSDAAPTSPGQQALLRDAGPRAPADIRRQVDADAHIAAANPGLTNRLLFWKDGAAPGTVLDPAEEQRRLRRDAAGGTGGAGQTPVVQHGGAGLLDGLF